MASDWIKMRTDLYRDPRVCTIADILINNIPSECDNTPRHNTHHRHVTCNVTRNVMRNAVVGALLSVWGVFRQRGKATGHDLTIEGISINAVDDISDLPGFGHAMQQVGWLLKFENTLFFPRFFEAYNVEPTVDTRSKNAERQRRYREKKAASNGGCNAENNVTGDVTVTSQNNARERERVRDKEDNKTPLPPVGGVTVTPCDVTPRNATPNHEPGTVTPPADPQAKPKTTDTKFKPERHDPRMAPLPFASERFARLWREWCDYRHQANKPVTEVSATKQLKILGEHTEEQAAGVNSRSQRGTEFTAQERAKNIPADKYRRPPDAGFVPAREPREGPFGDTPGGL